MNKKLARLRRARQTRIKIGKLNVHRLSVHRTNKHIYAQVFSICGTKVLASASTLEVEVRQALNAGADKKGVGGTKVAAAIVGKRIAEKAQSIGITKAAFDRSGLLFHGRVAELAQAAAQAGLKAT